MRTGIFYHWLRPIWWNLRPAGHAGISALKEMAIPWTSFVVWNLCRSGTRSNGWRKKSALKQNTKPTHMMQKVARVKVSLPRLLLMAFPIHRSLGLKMWPPSWQLPGSLPPDEVTLGFISRGLPGARSCHPETWLWILWWQGCLLFHYFSLYS